MEWIETSAKTVDEAKDLLLDRLGVDEGEAEFEVIEEPRAGLFGRVRGEARVRARVAPKSARSRQPRQKRQRSEGKASAGASTATADSPTSNSPSTDPKAGDTAAESTGRGDRARRDDRAARPKREDNGRREESTTDPETLVPVITEFLDGLVQSFGLPAKVSVVVEEGRLVASIDGDGLGQLIGPKGAVVDAIQELARTVAQKNSDGPAPRLRLDVGEYRVGRIAALEAFVTDVAAKVVATGAAHVFEPMGSAERKLVHDTASAIEGVGTVSEGEDPSRRVVLVKQ